jgi:hypothetical protein
VHLKKASREKARKEMGTGMESEEKSGKWNGRKMREGSKDIGEVLQLQLRNLKNMLSQGI